MIHEQIITTLIPRMFFASISSFFESIPGWGWWDIGFTLMVLVGICGESSKTARFMAKFLVPNKPLGLGMIIDWKAEKLKKWSERLLIVGIAGELICLPFSLWESARLNKDAADARLETIRLEQQIAQTSNNVVKIDPLNQPIASLTASVFLIEQGTKRTHIDPKTNITDGIFVTLDLGCSKQLYIRA